MIKRENIYVGMEVFVVNCGTKKVISTTIIDIYDVSEQLTSPQVKVANGIYGTFRLDDLLRLLNTDSSKGNMMYGLILTNSSNRFFISINEKDAYRHLAENVYDYDLSKIELKVEEIRKQYLEFVDKVGQIEKAREEIRKKHSEL